MPASNGTRPRRAKPRRLQPVEPLPEPGSFAYRVKLTKLDLVAVARDGVPEREWLPASVGMLVRGGTHLVAAEKKTGKSISFLSHSVRMALEGGRVAIFDRENGRGVYAERLGQMMDARQLTDAQRTVVAENLSYHEYPRGEGRERLKALAASHEHVQRHETRGSRWV